VGEVKNGKVKEGKVEKRRRGKIKSAGFKLETKVPTSIPFFPTPTAA
jgi:hypothetical protein